MKITANRSIIIAAIVVTVGFLTTYDKDYKWIGHLLAGLVTIGFLTGAVICGAALSGRLKWTPRPERFRLHRKLAVAYGFAAMATFLYGLWVMLPQEKHLLYSVHGRVGLAIVILSLFQILTSFALQGRRFIRPVHRWNGYALACLLVLQGALGALMSPLGAALPERLRISVPWLAVMAEDWVPDGIISPREYYTSRILDNGNYEGHYRSDGVHIYVGMKARTTGWVGIGSEASEGMLHANIIFGYVQNGKAVVIDSFGIEKFKHVPDVTLGGTDDILEFGGREEDGWTIIEYKRAIVTKDKYDSAWVPGAHKVVWAYGPDDSPESHHIARGYIDVDINTR